MIQEIVNYIKHLHENSPLIFEQNLKLSRGLHFFLELDKDGNAINFPGEQGQNWDYYDGKNMSQFLENSMKYEQQGERIGIKMNKVFDLPSKQLISCSPYIISFKKNKISGKSFDKIIGLLDSYFKKAIEQCLNGKKDKNLEIVLQFNNFLKNNLVQIENFGSFSNITDKDFINIYLNNVSLNDFKLAHDNYLNKNLFNKNDFNSDKNITDATYGLSGFLNGLNIKKPFLEHKTATMHKGLAGRIRAEDARYLNEFDLLLRRKIFPHPLPIFIDENEFKNSDEIISVFQEDSKLSYSQILKKLFNNNEERVLQNYYLLFFSYKYEFQDFDFVSKFRYSLRENEKYPEIINLFGLKSNKALIHNYSIKNIFHFEADIVKIIFNNSLVRIKDDDFDMHYFGEINNNDAIGGDTVYQIIMKYRKAFYDYVYKSKTQAINSLMWDEIMWNTIIGDLRNDEIKDNNCHSKEDSIKEKLNIWFSLYNYFISKKRRYEMASRIPELLDKMKKVANDPEQHFEGAEEFTFGAGQIIYFLLTKSKASQRTHALLEPFIQKVKAEQLQNSVAQAINTYKHEISFEQGRFERLSAEVLGFDTNENLKKYQRFLLAGYFAKPVI